MWLTPPRANMFAYWRDWLRTDVGRVVAHLTVPFLAIHALPSDVAAAAEKRADLQARYARAPMPLGGRVTYIASGGHSIWEYQPEVFDHALAAFVLGTGETTITR